MKIKSVYLVNGIHLLLEHIVKFLSLDPLRLLQFDDFKLKFFLELVFFHYFRDLGEMQIIRSLLASQFLLILCVCERCTFLDVNLFAILKYFSYLEHKHLSVFIPCEQILVVVRDCHRRDCRRVH